MLTWLGFCVSLPFAPLFVIADIRACRRHKQFLARQRQLELDLTEGE